MKIILLCTALAGLLLAVFLGILKVGEKLNAPINVSGEWAITGEFVNDVGESCIPITFQKKGPLLIIEQSGINLKAIFNDISKTEFSGSLKSNKAAFNQIIPSNKNSVKSNSNKMFAMLSMVFTPGKDKPEKLSGEWSISNCSTCGQIKFSAVRKRKN